jgi:hypothetical protein
MEIILLAWYVGLGLFGLLGLASYRIYRQQQELKALEERIMRLLMRRKLQK